MKNKIKLEVEKIDRILNNENPYDDWNKGRHSALRGVKVALESILNGATVKLVKVCRAPKDYLPCNVNNDGKCELPTHCDYQQTE